ncbi:class II aldolase/adducin family protein [Metabacillus litoralis]|uniref:class II aldolase/adducin family protein n=1 Tax=Metabacillus litoralis TaxID=152268 RepID=UPI00203FD222|nr:class II aldolase/adducin family protein [Metabacillus litoralis]MCM3160760.1 class II aldolase/adducin family protein [Metabacillus litoralis]
MNMTDQKINFSDERKSRKEKLAGAFRLFSLFGFDEGNAGHITVKDPEYDDCFWVNPYNMHFSRIKVSDLILVNHDGEVVEGNRAVNKAGFTIHSQLHKARPDVVAAAHAHSVYGKAWSTLGRLLDPINQEACAFYQDHSLYDAYTGVVHDLQEGERIGKALGNHKAVILQNHGLLTVGGSIEETVWWFVNMERSCQVQILAESVGKPVLIEEEHAKHTAAQVGTPEEAKRCFQPLWERIVHQQPDFLD